MNKTLRISLIITGILAVAALLVLAGTWIGRQSAMGWFRPDFGMMDGVDRFGYGRGSGDGMMNRNHWSDDGYGPGESSRPAGRAGGGCGRGYGPGMMYGDGADKNVTPLTTDQAYQAAQEYLASLNNPDLKVAEVMVFNNNAYVRVVEQSTGIGAFELLVDPASLAVTPEPGPNMMWNLKYGMMGGRGMGGMMGGVNPSTKADVSSTMTISDDQALQAAQTWLDSNMPGTQTAQDADPFYGYYTIDILRDGKQEGMLSVNGFSGQVFLHVWHGSFIESQEY